MPSDDSPSMPGSTSATPAAQIPSRVLTRPFATPRTIFALVMREMSTRYGQSPGGYLWAILEPLGAILLLSFGFSLLLRHPTLGSSFILFYATGFLPFSLYQSVANAVARSLTFSRPLLNYPAVTWVDALIARALLNTLTGAMVSYLVFAGVVVLEATNTVINVGPILVATAMSAMVGASVGSLNCLLGGLFPAWDIIWSIITRPLFLISGVLFTFEDLPRSIQSYLWYNPLVHVIGEMRRGFYPMYAPDYVSPSYVILLSLGILAFSLILLQRYHRDILNLG